MRMSSYPYLILYQCKRCGEYDWSSDVFAVSVRQCVCNVCMFRGAESVGESGKFADAFDELIRMREYTARHMCQVLT